MKVKQDVIVKHMIQRPLICGWVVKLRLRAGHVAVDFSLRPVNLVLSQFMHNDRIGKLTDLPVKVIVGDVKMVDIWLPKRKCCYCTGQRPRKRVALERDA